MKQLPVALQVFTVQSELNEDYPGTLKRIAQLGYSAIEIGGFGPYSTDEWVRVLKDCNLTIVSNHVVIELMEESFNHIAEFNRAIGNRRLVCPYLREERRLDAEGFKRSAEALNRIGKKCADRGFELYYHNHAYEFADFDGSTGMDILIRETDPALVRFEIDTCWVKYGGYDPADYIRRCRDRCHLIHLKDLAAGKKLVFKEVGEGIVDFVSVLEASEKAGAEWFIVEQDVCEGNPMDCAATSMRNIKRLQAPSGAAK